jgi:predicted SAM-dependent methyltransferase
MQSQSEHASNIITDEEGSTNRLLGALQYQDNETLGLDIGCGDNKLADIGVDIIRTPSVDIICDGYHLPFKDSVFKEVVMRGVIEHSPNNLQFLQEAVRVLSLNGKIRIATDNPQYYRYSVMRFGAGGISHPSVAPYHICILYPDNLKDLFKKVGLKTTELKWIPRHIWQIDWFCRLMILFKIWRKEATYIGYCLHGVKIR